MNGKGDRNRVSNWDAYHSGYNNVFKPKEPFYSDIKKYESAFIGGNSDSIQEDTSEDVGANPTSSTIETKPFKSAPIRHDIRRIIS
jgi:hypothetical protein